ncbi:hypothetical protein [Paracoccus mutanolyticus]|uniref:hypothetical protein n=1 Tax=Paracoccus mutanolyticus TaxID=1499308 RepID=UPI001671CD00|nr:hypothetical protein [Paracoccus mutanolyticus]
MMQALGLPEESLSSHSAMTLSGQAMPRGPRCCATSARTTETAGFYNTVGFNDDTRAFARFGAP